MQFDNLAALADYVSDEFSESALNEVLLLNTRLEAVSLTDMRQIKITCTNLEGVKLTLLKDEHGITYNVRPI